MHNNIPLPRKIRGCWQDIIYWTSALLYTVGVILVGVAMTKEKCPEEPGPCYFNFISHWYYIWFLSWFFVKALCRWSALARRVAFEFQFFNTGSVFIWSVLTAFLIITTTKGTLESYLPLNKDTTVGGYLFSLAVLHFWPMVVELIFLRQYKEFMAYFWRQRIMWLMDTIHQFLAFAYLLFVTTSPISLWIIYLAIFDPISVYHINVRYAKDIDNIWLIGSATLVISELALIFYFNNTYVTLASHQKKKRFNVLAPKTTHTGSDDMYRSIAKINSV